MNNEIKKDEYVKFGHMISKLTYPLYKILYKKVRAIGIVSTIALTYIPLNEFIDMHTTTLNYTPYLYIFILTIIGLSYLASKQSLSEYYTILFKQQKLINNYQKVTFRDVIKINRNTTRYILKTNIPISDLVKNMRTLDIIFKSNVTDISRYNKRFDHIIITTNRYLPNYKYEAKNNKNKAYSVMCGFKLLGVDISDYDKNELAYITSIVFNCDLRYSQLIKYISDLEVITGLKDIKLQGGKCTDYEIIINKKAKSPCFLDVLSSFEFNNKNIILGLDKQGKLFSIDFRKIYHTLIGGSTGKGKSNLSHVIISSLIKSDMDISLFLLDPKRVELKRYRDINRCYYTGDKEEMLKVLEEIEKEMRRRNKLFDDDKFINNIEMWNKKKPDEKLNYIIIYIEEIADLMLSSGKEYKAKFENIIKSLAGLSRNVGMRMFLSTQKPVVEVVNGIIKGNTGTKIAFQVPTAIDSKTILDNSSASKLTGVGSMIYQHNGEDIIIQAPLLNDSDVEKLVYYLENNHNVSSKYSLSENFVSTVSNVVKPMVIEDNSIQNELQNDTLDTKGHNDIEKVIINNELDLLEFYQKENFVLSVRETAKRVNIGVTKIQELRTELKRQNKLKLEGKKLVLNNKGNLRIIKWYLVERGYHVLKTW